MTATFNPESASMSSDNNDPCDRLLQIARQYAQKSLDPRDREFLTHIEAIAQQPIDSHKRKRAIGNLYLFLKGLPYNADKRFQGGSHENIIKEEYETIFDEVITEALKRMWSEFNPTGESFTGCFINWVNEKLRLRFLLIEFYSKIKRETPDEIQSSTFEDPISLTDLTQQIASDQQISKKHQVQVLDAFAEDVERAPFWQINYLMNEPRCNYRMLTKRLIFGTEKIQTIVDEFQFKYQAFYARYKRDFLPELLARRLEQNLYTPLHSELIKEAIASSSTLAKPVKAEYVDITPKFMAQKCFPMFCHQPLTLEEIVEQLKVQKPKTYKNLDEPKLEDLWRRKCYPKIGEVVAQVLGYGKGSDI